METNLSDFAISGNRTVQPFFPPTISMFAINKLKRAPSHIIEICPTKHRSRRLHSDLQLR